MEVPIEIMHHRVIQQSKGRGDEHQIFIGLNRSTVPFILHWKKNIKEEGNDYYSNNCTS
jgi:hypothetical protein